MPPFETHPNPHVSQTTGAPFYILHNRPSLTRMHMHRFNVLCIMYYVLPIYIGNSCGEQYIIVQGFGPGFGEIEGSEGVVHRSVNGVGKRSNQYKSIFRTNLSRQGRIVRRVFFDRNATTVHFKYHVKLFPSPLLLAIILYMIDAVHSQRCT